MIPLPWAAWTACATKGSSRAASRGSTGCRRSRFSRLGPSTYSSQPGLLPDSFGRPAANLVDLNDVRVVEPGHRLGLELEAGQVAGSGDLLDHFQGDDWFQAAGRAAYTRARLP